MTSAQKKKKNTIQENQVKETCPTYGAEDCWEVKNLRASSSNKLQSKIQTRSTKLKFFFLSNSLPSM